MKNKLLKNGMVLAGGFVLAIVLTIVFGWSMKTLSDMLTYCGVAIMAYGAYVASNIASLFSNVKTDINARYSPDQKKDREDLFKKRLIDGWLYLGTGAVLVAVSIIVIRL